MTRRRRKQPRCSVKLCPEPPVAGMTRCRGHWDPIEARLAVTTGDGFCESARCLSPPIDGLAVCGTHATNRQIQNLLTFRGKGDHHGERGNQPGPRS